jgi:hypothetical protein
MSWLRPGNKSRRKRMSYRSSNISTGGEPAEELIILFGGAERLAKLKREALNLLRNYRFPSSNV